MKRLLSPCGQRDSNGDALAGFPGFNLIFVGEAEAGMPPFTAPSESQPFSSRRARWELNKLALLLVAIIRKRFPSAREFRRSHAGAIVLQRPGIANRAWPANRNLGGAGVVSVRDHLNKSDPRISDDLPSMVSQKAGAESERKIQIKLGTVCRFARFGHNQTAYYIRWLIGRG
jgi:hypothetical protein